MNAAQDTVGYLFLCGLMRRDTTFIFTLADFCSDTSNMSTVCETELFTREKKIFKLYKSLIII